MLVHALTVAAALAGGLQPPPYTVAAPDILSVEVGGLPKRFAPVGGECLVRPDGTIGLGEFGSVRVAGLTVPQVKQAVADRLRQSVAPKRADRLTVRVDVTGYNSRFYYVVRTGPGEGESVVRLPFTGNERAFDALSLAGWLGSAGQVWVSRPLPGGGVRTLPVVNRPPAAVINPQVLPGDTVFVAADAGQPGLR